MENVFKPGDTIYHPSIGKGKVTDTDGRLVYFTAENGENVCATKAFAHSHPGMNPTTSGLSLQSRKVGG